jgi:hypothetical protein
MPLTMSKAVAQREYETGIWENGTYSFSLKGIRVGVQHDSFNDVDRVRAQFIFEDEDGGVLESNTINLTKNLAYNDKSKFFEYLGALHGERIKESDVVVVTMPGVDTWEDAEALPRFYTSGERPVDVTSVTVNGVEVLGNGKKPNITLSKEISSKGNPYNKIVTIAPSGGGGKVKREKPAGAPE